MKKRFLLTSALMLLLTVLALTSATYAWFTMSTTNRVNDFTMTAASADGGLEISIDGQVFDNNSVSIANPTLRALDITTADGKTFYKAKTVNQSTGEVTQVQAGPQAGRDYFEYKLYFRTSVAGTIRLDLKRSYVVPASLATATYVDGDDTKHYLDTDVNGNNTFTFAAGTENKSSLGEFTRDWIAAATRVSFEVTGYQHGEYNVKTVKPAEAENNAKYLQATFTNSGMKGICEPFKTTAALVQNTVTNTWSMTGSKVAQTMSGLAATTDSNVMNITGAGYVTQPLLADADYLNLFTLDNNNFNNGDTAILEVTVRVWIEGQDAEAKAALALGNFTTALTFEQDVQSIPDIIQVSYNNGTILVEKDVVDGKDKIVGFAWSQKSDAIESIELYKGDSAVVAADGTYTGNTFRLAQAIEVVPEDNETTKAAVERLAADYKLKLTCVSTVTNNGKTLDVYIPGASGYSQVTTSNNYFSVGFEYKD